MILQCQNKSCTRLYDTNDDGYQDRWYWGELRGRGYDTARTGYGVCSANDIQWCQQCIDEDRLRVFGDQEKLKKKLEEQNAKDKAKKEYAIILESKPTPYDPNEPKKQLTISDLVKKWGGLMGLGPVPKGKGRK